MKIISNKKYKYLTDVEKEYKQVIVGLKEELKEAKDLKSVLELLGGNRITSGYGITASYMDGITHISFGDNVLVYVDDILGGKVIKQEANKALIIDKDGNVKTGLTRQAKDKGFNYKLVRE